MTIRPLRRFAMASQGKAAPGKLTQTQLAVISGINQGEISGIERGQTNPRRPRSPPLLAPLGARLGVVTGEGRDLAHA
jgi:Helix-turn-helix